MLDIFKILNLNIDRLYYYSNYTFLKEFDKHALIRKTVIEPIESEIISNNICVKEIIVKHFVHYFLYKKLVWDTNYFGFPVYRLEIILFEHSDSKILKEAFLLFMNSCIKKGDYFMLNIPSEDLLLIQAISNTPFILVETRLNYYFDNFKNLPSARYPVRNATTEDISALKAVSIKMRNNYDRVHADPVFGLEVADKYLGSFLEESIKGFADIVLVPDVANTKPFGFLAGNYPEKILNKNIAKLVLAAIDSNLEKGWLYKLLSEMIYKLKESQVEYLTTITQISNRAAISTWEKAGFKLGFSKYLFTYKKS